METAFNTRKNILFIVQSLWLWKNRGPPKNLHVTVKALSSYKKVLSDVWVILKEPPSAQYN